MKDLKESNTIESTEYITPRGIQDDTAFSLWVQFTLSKIDTIIAEVTSRVRKSSHKYSIEIPTSVEHAKRFDKKNGSRFWKDDIDLDMSNVGIEFKILDQGEIPPPG